MSLTAISLTPLKTVRVPPNNRDGERGVILILTLFVVMITFALVTQLTIRTSVAHQTAKNSSTRVRMEYAAINAGQEILRTMADDMPAAAGEEGAMDALSGVDGGEGGTGGPPQEGDEGQEEEDDGSNSDSFEDEWARPARYTLGDIEVHAFVQDENSKLNLLTLFDPDEELRQEARDRFVRILDYLREDMDDDLDQQAANMILEDLVQWVEGDARDLQFPPPLRHSVTRFVDPAISATAPEGEESGFVADESGDEPQVEEIVEIFLPYSLEELMLLEHVDEELFYDQLRPNDEIAPGLESVFTVYSSLALDPPETESPETDVAGLTGVEGAAGATDGLGEGDGEGESQSALDSAEGGLDDLLEAGAGIGMKININTTHAAVLKGLMPRSEMPEFIVDSILRHRNEEDEEALAEQEGEDVDYDEVELRRSIYRNDQPTPHRYFRNMDDLTQVEGWEDRFDPESAEKFQTLIGVQSDVFSVYLWCRIQPKDWQQEHHYEEPPGAILRMKAVVWRRAGEDGAKFIFIEPWHEVPYSRWRIPDFQRDIPVYQEPLY